MTKPIKTIKENVILKNRFVEIYNDDVELPDGSLGTFFRTNQGSGIIVVPVTSQHEIITQEEYRYAQKAFIRQLPMGGFDANDESMEDAAARELAEEIGYKAGCLIKIGEYVSDPGCKMGTTHAYLALDCEPLSHTAHEATEVFRNLTLTPIAEVDNLIASTKCVMTIANLRHFAADKHKYLK